MPDSKTDAIEEKKTWSTSEELLLACAVKRHGLKDWDSVVMELQMRCPVSSTLTSEMCETKYYDLRRRFTNILDDERSGGNDDSVPWLDELRKLRVSELKQEVHRYDLSIQSLQTKVKRLQDDHERSLKDSENGYGKPDLEKELDEARSETDKQRGVEAPEKTSPGETDGKFVSGRVNRSSNESSSTDNREKDAKRISEPIQTGDVKPDPDPKTFKEDSCNDSSDTIAKQSQEKRVDGDSGELRDSAAESKEGMKESSDVQSSASLTKQQRRRRGEVSGGGNGGGGGGCDEPVVVSPATTIKRETSGKSESLIEFLHIIKSHKHGYVFERRLDDQRTDAYESMVRQHVDLETVNTRLDEGTYACCAPKFYLDLLLLFTNAIVFFPKSSHESSAAHQLRELVLKELGKKRTEQHSSPSSDSTVVPTQPKPEPEKSESLLDKQKTSAPIFVCRKRSLISSKATSSTSNLEKEKVTEEKPAVPNLKPPSVKSSSSTPVEEESPLKLKVKEKPVTGVRSMRRSSTKATPSVSVPNKNQMTNSNASQGTTSSSKMEAGKTEKKKEVTVPVTTAAATTTMMTKKRGAADFLKRMKKNSPVKGASSVSETPKASTTNTSNEVIGGRREQKKKVEEQRREGMVRRSGGGRQSKTESSPSKRTIGRPPKKEKEATPAPTPAKRGREGGNDTEGSSKRPKKRSRK